MTMTMKIRLTQKEYACLMEDDILSKSLVAAVENVLQVREGFELELSDQEANEIRDLCGERLQEVGYDENYDPNKKGKLLESLVDKLFIG